MPKLNQIIAIEKGVKNRVRDAITELYKQAVKPELYYGFNKNYEPKAADGEMYPPESKKVTLRSGEVLAEVAKLFIEVIDVTATKDFANMAATATLAVDGTPLVDNVPVSHLLFLEKQFVDLRTFVDKMPILDESENWTKDEAAGLFRTDEEKRHRLAKTTVPIVLYDATAEHPAQTQLIQKDEIVGYWSEVKQSGAITRDRRRILLHRMEEMLDAIKSAREEANGMDAPYQYIGDDLLEYIFA